MVSHIRVSVERVRIDHGYRISVGIGEGLGKKIKFEKLL